ncbi:uncharacterized protein PFL1_05412 [Pseudozyma flocculosa PF-1]|uniref:Related to hexose transporter protein n=2 Tax=Pseudozyma flocculosa TaxID=84751 RepID=A0A5C3FA42_9BASI|nr:uncharacterized protein PFL1_05412 [Pseudozyma flocculosa PF-1]EPQ27131.1 hypothetical protein PFL1_05412 [Pseudozyma flocculosa PF-1]SPO41292.1 related to hexose transporter protein [Pseudozyma flocculosa]
MFGMTDLGRSKAGIALSHRPPALSDRLAAIPNNTNQSLWILDPGLRRLNFWMLVCLVSSYATGFDGSLFTGLQTLERWSSDLGNPDSNLTGIIGMSGIIGIVFAPFVGGWLNDRLGRSRTMLIAATIAVVGGALTAVKLDRPSHQRDLFICARVVLSLASGLTMVASPILMAELAHPRQRAAVASLYQCGFYSGAVVAAWMTFGTNRWSDSWSWRLPCLFQIFPFVLQIGVLWWCPQSPRWLVAQGRRDDALEVLATYHANGDRNDPLVRFELDEIAAAIEAEKAAAATTFRDLVATRGNRQRMWVVVTLAFATQWCGNGVISYYLSRILASIGIGSTRQQAVFNGGLAIFNLVVATSAAFTAERFGRRRLFIVSAFGMLASFVVITVCSAVYARSMASAAGSSVIAFLFLFFFFYDIAMTPLSFSYPVEILPYNVRSKGMSVSVSVLAVAACFNIWVNPIALAAIGWKLYLVYIAVLVLFCINVLLTYPETRGRTVEEIAVVFDGVEGAAAAVVAEVDAGRLGVVDEKRRQPGGAARLATFRLAAGAGGALSSSSATTMSKDDDAKKDDSMRSVTGDAV